MKTWEEDRKKITIMRKTHNISSVGKPVNASVGTCCSIFPSRRSARKCFSCTNETSSKCITALPSSCLPYAIRIFVQFGLFSVSILFFVHFFFVWFCRSKRYTTIKIKNHISNCWCVVCLVCIDVIV